MKIVQSGMLVVNKEPGYTSSDVVAKLRGILGIRKIGHTGTLDPAAEGVLPVCIGYATRLCDMIAARDKSYEAVLRLGQITDTQDMTGTVQRSLSPAEVQQTLTQKAAAEGCSVEELILRRAASFQGRIRQKPPRYSAIWVGGRRAYDLARKGVDFELPEREITIDSLTVTGIDLPLVRLSVTCSPGTYIRTLCEDLGNALGTGGAMEHLVRTRVGMFTLEKAIRLDEIAEQVREDPAGFTKAYIYPTDFFFRDLPAVKVNEASMRYLRNGNALSEDNLTAGTRLQETQAALRVYGWDDDFYGIYRYDAVRRRLVCVKMFHAVDGTKN